MLKKFQEDRGIKDKTVQGYEIAINHYSNFHKKDIKDLVQEAVDEQMQDKPELAQNLFHRLEEYRKYLLELIDEYKLSPSTAKQRFGNIKTFYRHWRVKVPKLYDIQITPEPEPTYFDLPTKKHIRQAINVTNGVVKAIILFMCSSGQAKAETLNLTVGDFIRATMDYHSDGDIQNILEELLKRHDVIPLFYMRRIKTNIFYFTCCSPEATRAIVKYLLTRDNLEVTDKLFDITDRNLMDHFARINDKMKWGHVGKFNFFTTHALRKFHGSNIGLNPKHVNALQGRSNSEITRIYMRDNPEHLRNMYASVVDNVTIEQSEEPPSNQEIHLHINVMLMGSDYGIQI